MKAAIISNCDLCIPLLHFCRQAKMDTIFYLGLHKAGTDINAVLQFCAGNNIPVETEKEPGQLYQWLAQHKPDYGFVFGYKKLIDVNRLGELTNRIFNIHPGKLPQYRGASPVFWQLKNGERSLALTIHFITSRFDAGNIVWSREIGNESHFSHGLVEYLFSNMVIEGVQYILNTGVDALKAKGIVQDEKLAVKYKTPVLNDVLINWKTMQAGDIVNLVKACNPWNKGAITMCNNIEVKIIDAEVLQGKTDKTGGTITAMGQGVTVACAGNSLLAIHSFNINGIFTPARFAGKLGFAGGQRFFSP